MINLNCIIYTICTNDNDMFVYELQERFKYSIECLNHFIKVDESISKTFNMPKNATQDDVYGFLLKTYHHNLKGVAIFRDGCLQEKDKNKT